MKARTLWIISAIVLVMVLALTLFACGQREKPNDTPGGDNGQTGENGQTGDNAGGNGQTNTGDTGDTPADTTDGNIAVPQSVAVDAQGKVTWTRVTGATYKVRVNGTVYTSRFNTYNLMTMENKPADGHFAVEVCAVIDDKDGGWSRSVTFDYQGDALVTPSVQGLEGTSLCWKDNAQAQYPVVMLGTTAIPLAKGTTSYDLASVEAETTVSLHWAGDGVYNLDSAAVRLVYAPATKTLSYAPPTDVYMQGDILHFGKVEGATVYYFKDVYNTVTSISGDEINALQSDRNGKFLVSSVWVGNPDVPIANSVATPVTYFTEAQGKGTAEEPYLIANLGEMRYIEYYEAQQQANKYYRLVNDIVFPAYTPADDEDYSNFYNLGSLSGTLDGAGHTLKNIVVYYKDGYSSIFDNITKDGVICDLRIEDTAWRTWTNRTNDGVMHEKGGECAILAYTNRGTIRNVTLVSGSVTAVRDGGAGLVAINRGTIDHCTVQKDFRVYGANEAGAIAIYNAGTITDCINYGSVGGRSTVGGIVGRNAGLVTRCGNHGEVTGDVYGGGIVGYNYNVAYDGTLQYETLVSLCYNVGHVTCTAYCGGIVGRNGSNGYNELGIDNYANAGIYGCYNRGVVTGMISVAGIAGENNGYLDKAKNCGVVACYNSGDINQRVGGFETNGIYLSVSACSWAESDLPAITVHYWVGTGDVKSYQTAWPGVKMQKIKVGTSYYYYAPCAVDVKTLTGVIFTRSNPNKYDESSASFVSFDGRLASEGGDVYNKTEDVLGATTKDCVIYYIDADWHTADRVDPSAAAIAGYNNGVNDCYYVKTTVGGTSTELPAVTTGTASDCEGYTQAERKKMQDVYKTLNDVLGAEVFASQIDQYPVLLWQLEN